MRIKTALVDVENDDAIVYRSRHREFQPGVVDNVIQLIDQPDLEIPDLRGVNCEHQNDGQTECDPDDVLLQAPSPGSALGKT
jgi:hypothetical protein